MPQTTEKEENSTPRNSTIIDCKNIWIATEEDVKDLSEIERNAFVQAIRIHNKYDKTFKTLP
jgi:hypothetical protein